MKMKTTIIIMTSMQLNFCEKIRDISKKSGVIAAWAPLISITDRAGSVINYHRKIAVTAYVTSMMYYMYYDIGRY